MVQVFQRLIESRISQGSRRPDVVKLRDADRECRKRDGRQKSRLKKEEVSLPAAAKFDGLRVLLRRECTAAKFDRNQRQVVQPSGGECRWVEIEYCIHS